MYYAHTISSLIFENVLSSVSPSITTRLETEYKNINEVAKLTCKAHGVPTPRVTWRRKNRKSHRGMVSNVAVGNLVTSRLTISGVQKDDAGHYVCNARNKLGNFQRERVLVVQGTGQPCSSSMSSIFKAKTSCKNDSFISEERRGFRGKVWNNIYLQSSPKTKNDSSKVVNRKSEAGFPNTLPCGRGK